MKRFAQVFLLLASSLIALASEPQRSFRVEFPFTVNGAVMPAGDYVLLAVEEEANSLRLVHEGSGKSVFVNLPATDVNRYGPRAYPQIVFRCQHDACEVASVTNVRPGLVFSSWKSKLAERNVYLRTVALR